MIKPFKFASRQLDLSITQVMGVLNVTPDSFSDGGKFNQVELALSRAEAMVDEGATIIDIGGESTRPGASPVSVQEELDRVCPAVECVSKSLDVVISVDTSRPEVMAETISLGAGLMNDVRAFTLPGVQELVAKHDVALCLMHMKGTPLTMQAHPKYVSVKNEVFGFLELRAQELIAAGVYSERIILDPGFGFGKTLEHNMELLSATGKLCKLGYPVLIGLSRKSMFAALLNRQVDERLFGSIAAATIGASLGASILRVHDVQATVDAARVVDAVRRFQV
jgi:dihydropteroate synthase